MHGGGHLDWHFTVKAHFNQFANWTEGNKNGLICRCTYIKLSRQEQITLLLLGWNVHKAIFRGTTERFKRASETSVIITEFNSFKQCERARVEKKGKKRKSGGDFFFFLVRFIVARVYYYLQSV
jgi:hypothetical protein